MADLTLERIAELRACHDKVRSFHGTHDLGGLAAAMHEWSRQLQMSSEALLAAAERGLTQDRKAAAFDALAALKEFEVSEDSGESGLYYEGNRTWAPTLLEAVEKLQAKEPTDAQ